MFLGSNWSIWISGCKNCEASGSIIRYIEFVTMIALQSLQALNVVTFLYGDNTLLCCCAVVRISYFYQSQDSKNCIYSSGAFVIFPCKTSNGITCKRNVFVTRHRCYVEDTHDSTTHNYIVPRATKTSKKLLHALFVAEGCKINILSSNHIIL